MKCSTEKAKPLNPRKQEKDEEWHDTKSGELFEDKKATVLLNRIKE